MNRLIPQTDEMVHIVLQALLEQETQTLNDPDGFGTLSTDDKKMVVQSCANRRVMFTQMLASVRDNPKLRLQIVTEVLAVMTLMAGADCDHGSCPIVEEFCRSVDFWRDRLPLFGQPVGTTH